MRIMKVWQTQTLLKSTSFKVRFLSILILMTDFTTAESFENINSDRKFRSRKIGRRKFDTNKVF